MSYFKKSSISSSIIFKIRYVRSLALFALTLFPIIVFAQKCNTTIPPTTPTNRFTVNNNDTVSDTQTGLMWKKCSEGQSGANCSMGNAKAYTWQLALQQAQTVNKNGSFAGYSDWRVPNIKELLSIIEKNALNLGLT
jgi:hypothetical protein